MYRKILTSVKVFMAIMLVVNTIGYGLVYPLFVQAQQEPIPQAKPQQDAPATCNIEVEQLDSQSYAFIAVYSDQFDNLTWNFGDGESASGERVEHTYTSEAEFAVTLTCAGTEETLSSTVSVFADLPDPEVTETLTPVTVTAIPATRSVEETPELVEPNNPINGELEGEGGSNPVGATCRLNLTDNNDADPFTFYFEAIGTGIESYNWNFGSGAPVSGVSNYVMSYPATGDYTITLTCVDNEGADIVLNGYVSITSVPVASFTLTPATTGFSPFTVYVVNLSSGGVLSYLWEVTVPIGAPSIPNSTATNPSYTFTFPGTYTITLTVTDSINQTSVVFADVVVVAPPPLADFSVTPGSGTVSTVFTVQAEDLLEGPIDTLTFDFGDGSPLVNGLDFGPHTHTYAAQGTYWITMAYSGPGGNGSVSRQVGVYPDGTTVFADFTYTITGNVPGGIEVCFDNISDGPIIHNFWDFGDGSPVVENNAKIVCHVYASEQTYPVQLRVEAADPLVFSERDVNVIVVGGPEAVITATPSTSIVYGQSVTFNPDSSTGVITVWEWDLDGNGSFETVQRYPSAVTFTNLGANLVSLRVTGPGGTSTAQIVIQVAQLNLTCSIAGNLNPNVSNQAYNATVGNVAGRPLTYQWTVTGPAGGATIVSPNAEDTNVNWTIRGTYVLTFTVSTANGASCTDSVTVEVDYPQLTCSITGNFNPIPDNSVYTYTANIPNLAGRTPIYQWYLNGNPVGTNSATLDLQWNNIEPTEQISLVVTTPDGTGACSVPAQTITVRWPDLTCAWSGSIDVSPNPLQGSDTYTLVLTGLNGLTPDIEWFVDGVRAATESDADALSITLTWTFDQQANHTVRAEVSTDAAQGPRSGSCFIEQNLNVNVPTLQCRAPLGDRTPVVGETVNYDRDLRNVFGRTISSTLWDLQQFDTINGVWVDVVVGFSGNPFPRQFLVENELYRVRYSATVDNPSLITPTTSCGPTDWVNITVEGVGEDFACDAWTAGNDFSPLSGTANYSYSLDIDNSNGRTLFFEWILTDGNGIPRSLGTFPAGGFTGDNTFTQIFNGSVFAPADAYTLSVNVTSTNSSYICSYPAQNLVVGELNVEYSWNVNRTQVAVGELICLTNISTTSHDTTPATNTMVYDWNLDDISNSLGIVTFAGAALPDCFSFPAEGQYDLVLRGTSLTGGLTETFTRRFFVYGLQSIAIDRENEQFAGNNIDFSAIAVNIDSYAWQFFDDLGNSLGTRTGQNVTFFFANPGTYRAVVTGTGDLGPTVAEVTFELIGINDIRAAFIPSTYGGLATLNVCFTDRSYNQSTITTWTWNFGDGSPAVVYNTYQPQICHTYATAGQVYNVTLQVTDGVNTANASNVIRTYNVVEANATFTIEPRGNGEFCFTPILSPGINVTEWIFDAPNGPVYPVTNNNQICHTYASSGGYLVTMRVTDGTTPGEITRPVTVDLTTPIVPATFDITPTCAIAGPNSDGSFEVTNTGGDMTTPDRLVITDENGNILLTDDFFQLDNGESITYNFSSAGGQITLTTLNTSITFAQNCPYPNPIIDVQATCNGNFARFTISNSGGPMLAAESYEVRDASNNLVTSGTFNIDYLGADVIVNVPNPYGQMTFISNSVVGNFNVSTTCSPVPALTVTSTCSYPVTFTVENTGGPMVLDQAFTITDSGGNPVVYSPSGTTFNLGTGGSVTFSLNGLDPYEAYTFNTTGFAGTVNEVRDCADPALVVTSTCSYPVTFTVTNTGGAMLTPQAFSITDGGGNPVVYSPADTTFNLAVGGSVTYSLNGLNPYAPYTFNTTGFAGAANEVRDCADPALVVTSTCSYPVTFTVTNTGGAMLTPQAFSITDGGGNPVVYSPADTTFSLAVGGSVIYSLDGLNPYAPYTFNTTGFAGTANEVRDCADPALVVTSTCSYPVTFTVTNTGGAMLTPQAFSITDGGGNPVVYSPADTTFSLAVGGSVIYSLDGLNPYAPYTFNTTGFAGAANEVRDCEDPELSIGGLCGTPVALQLSNLGGDMLTPQSFTITGPNGETVDFTPDVNTFELAGGTYLTFYMPAANPYDYYTFATDGFAGSPRFRLDCESPELLTVTATCGNPTTFVVSNSGGDMLAAHDVTVTDTLGNNIPVSPASFQLNNGDSVTITTQGVSASIYVFTATGLAGTFSTTLNCSEPIVVAELTEDPERAVFRGINDLPAWDTVATCGFNCPTFELYHTDEIGNWEIFRLDGADATNRETIRLNLSQGFGDGVDDVAPSRSPNAEWIVFSSNRDGNWEIYVAPTNGDASLIQRVTYNNFAIDTDPVWGPHNYVVFESTRDGNWELYVVDMETGEEFRLTDNDANDINPFWSPDGSKIIFQSDRVGFWQIYEVNLMTRSIRLLSDGAGDDVDPQYSHDGSKIMFRSYRDGENSVLYMMNADGTDVEAITAVDEDATNHAWSPDDRLVAFQSDLGGDLDIYIYEVATGERRLLTDNDIPDYAPTWLCDSTHVLFTSDIEGNPDIYEALATPISDPAILVEEDADQMTFEAFNDIYPEGTPSEENASREGQTVVGPFGEQTTFLLPDFSLTDVDLNVTDAETREDPNIDACSIN